MGKISIQMSFLFENYINFVFFFLKTTLLYMLMDQSNLNICYGCFIELYINTGDSGNLDTLGWGSSQVSCRIIFVSLTFLCFILLSSSRERESNRQIDLVVCFDEEASSLFSFGTFLRLQIVNAFLICDFSELQINNHGHRWKQEHQRQIGLPFLLFIAAF